MTRFREWMRRCNGEWESNRRYIYPNSKIQNLVSDLIIDFQSETEEEFVVNLKWKTRTCDNDKEVSKGEMLTIGTEDKLKRNVGYYTDNSTVCDVTMIDDDCVELVTRYNGMKFREEIRLVDDNTRLRQTIGWKENTDDVILVGQYYEKRKTFI